MASDPSDSHAVGCNDLFCFSQGRKERWARQQPQQTRGGNPGAGAAVGCCGVGSCGRGAAMTLVLEGGCAV